MKRMTMSMAAGALALGVVALPLGAQQNKDAPKPPAKPATTPAQPAGGAPQMSPEMAQCMERMQAYGALNENHAYLKQFEGEWECVSKCWMSPHLPPETNKTTAIAKVAYDGRFLIEKHQGQFTMGEGAPPQTFNGTSTVGYDNFRKQFVSTWIDNWSTGIYIEYGSVSEGGKVFTFEGENYSFMTGKLAHTRTVVTIVDADTRKLEAWGPGLDGKVFKTMEMTYTRKK